MPAVVTVLHVIVCIFLIAVVLLQRGKGAQIGAVFGGGAGSTLFGSRGAGNFLTKLTAIAATLYMLTSLSLSYFGIAGAGERLFQNSAAAEQHAKDAAKNDLFQEVGKAPAEAAKPESAPAQAPAPDAAAQKAPAAPEVPAPDAH